jgi:hypothetical protein
MGEKGVRGHADAQIATKPSRICDRGSGIADHPAHAVVRRGRGISPGVDGQRSGLGCRPSQPLGHADAERGTSPAHRLLALLCVVGQRARNEQEVLLVFEVEVLEILYKGCDPIGLRRDGKCRVRLGCR